MKRSWDVIRKIMIALEEIPDEGGQLDSGAIPGVDNETAFYHMRMMIEAAFAVGGCPEAVGTLHGFLFRLTWEGHELLDKISKRSPDGMKCNPGMFRHNHSPDCAALHPGYALERV